MVDNLVLKKSYPRNKILYGIYTPISKSPVSAAGYGSVCERSYTQDTNTASGKLATKTTLDAK